MKNGVLYLVFPALMEEKLLMVISNYILSKVEDNNCLKVMPVLLVKLFFTIRLTNPIYFASSREKQMKKIQLYILLKYLLHQKE